MKRSGWGSTAAGALIAFLTVAAPARTQTAAVVVAEENFRSEPGGSILAELYEGTRLSVGEEQGSWRRATVEAWIWGRSVREQRSGDLDLLVNAEGENLRATPNGDRIGRALGGMRLDRVEVRGDWIRVRRTGWIWSPSLGPVEGAPAGRPVATRSSRPAREPAVDSAPESGGTGSPAVTPGSGVADAARAGRSDSRFAVVPEAAILVGSPGGDTVARLRPGTRVEVVAREGDWSRVRIEGWTFSGSLAPPDSGNGGILTGISKDSLLADPERYRGRVLEWSLQFIALQEAERFRTDFLEGEPFMLTRGPGEDPGFVYVAVAPDRLAEVQTLSPLGRIRIVARVRTARSSLTGAPVLDLLEITRR